MLVQWRERLLLIRRGAEVPHPGYWAPLSGKVEPGESQAAAVAREVREEVGLAVRVDREVWECPSDDGAFRLHWWTAAARTNAFVPNAREVAAARWILPAQFGAFTPTFVADRQFFSEVWPGL